MAVHTYTLALGTQGESHMIDISGAVSETVHKTGLLAGIVTLFVPGATAALTTIEYEPGALQDFKRLFAELAPEDREYAHNARWGDGNGHSHVRAALLGPSLTVPFADGKLLLGTWQHIILVDFDNRSRERAVIAQVIGE
jgi:secondary thiamine-phosphate synthase enzyme